MSSRQPPGRAAPSVLPLSLGEGRGEGARRSTPLLVCCLALLSLLLHTGPVRAADRPNLVLAIADDWGWPHAGAYGDRVLKTPTFDRLAREGVLFTHAFVSSPSCTPSRGALITG